MLAGTAAGMSCFVTKTENASRPSRFHASCRLSRRLLSVTAVAAVVVTTARQNDYSPRRGECNTGMTELPSRYDVTVTIDSDGGYLPNPAKFAVAAERAATARTASIVSAHTADQVVSVVSTWALNRPAAVSVALAVVSEALESPVAWLGC